MIKTLKSWLSDPLGKKRLQRRISMLEELLDDERLLHRKNIKQQWHEAEKHFELRTKQIQAECNALRSTLVKLYNTQSKPIVVPAGALKQNAPID